MAVFCNETMKAKRPCCEIAHIAFSQTAVAQPGSTPATRGLDLKEQDKVVSSKIASVQRHIWSSRAYIGSSPTRAARAVVLSKAGVAARQ